MAQGGQGGIAGDPNGWQRDSFGRESLTKSHILTPGDIGDWPLEVKAGEVWVATASSRIFDPAVEIVDEKGGVLKSNDDIAPGVQDARVLMRFESDGKYRVIVKGFKSVAGGEYSLNLTKVMSRKVTRESVTAVRDDRWFWVEPEHAKSVVSFGRGATLEGIQGFDENGAALGFVGTNVGAMIFREDQKPILVGRIGGMSDVELRVMPWQEKELVIGTAHREAVMLPRGGVCDYLVKVKKGDFLRVDLGVPEFEMSVKGDSGFEGAGRRVVSLAAGGKVPKGSVILANEDREVRFRCFWVGDEFISLTAGVERILDGLDSAGVKEAELPYFGVDYVGFEGKPGDYWEFTAVSGDFDVEMTLFNPEGVSFMRSDDDLGVTDAKVLALLNYGGQYRMGVKCVGGGGKGKYRLVGRKLPKLDLTAGEEVRKSESVASGEIYDVSGRQGDRVLFYLLSGNESATVSIFGPDGRNVASVTANDHGAGTKSFVLPQDGTYTVWVRAGGADYRMKWLVMDK